MKAGRLLQLVGPLYGGFIKDDALLLDVLTSVSRLFAADSCYLVIQSEAEAAPLMRYAHAPVDDHHVVRVYDEHYSKLNPFRQFISRPEHLGKSYSSGTMIAPGDFERSEFYNDFCRKLGWHHVLAAAFHNRENRLGYIILNRADTIGQFDTGDEAALDQLLPHMANAYAMRTSFSDAFSSVEQALFCGEQKQAGIILLDASGRIVVVNDYMRQIFGAADGLSYRGGEIVGGGWEDTKRIRSLIETAVSSATSSDIVPIARKLTIRRPSGRDPYVVETIPIMVREQFVEGNNIVAALRVVAPELSVEQRLVHDFEKYRLTPAETRLARHLIAGLRPKEVAARTGLSLNTIHVQQRSIYRKLGISRHFELMRIFAPNWGYTGTS